MFFLLFFVSGRKARLATIGLAGPGVGAGVIFAGLLTAAAHNPFMKNHLFVWAILGFALTEALALFALMMAFSSYLLSRF